MSTIYSRIQNNFTQISNQALLDVRLSSKAYKLYAYMCYRIGTATHWEFNEKEIMKHFKEGRDAIRSARTELIECGWLVKTQKRVAGKFSKNDYEIFATLDHIDSEPMTENPSTDSSSTENSTTGNPPYSNKEENNKDLNNKDLFSLEEIEKFFEDNKFKSSAKRFWLRNEKTGWKNVKNRRAAAFEWEEIFLENNDEDNYKDAKNITKQDDDVSYGITLAKIINTANSPHLLSGAYLNQEEKDMISYLGGVSNIDTEDKKRLIDAIKKIRLVDKELDN